MGLVTVDSGRKGMGAYPDDPWYDPNRPSWLPYWIDSLTESYRKYKYYLYELPATADKPYPNPVPPPPPSSPSSSALKQQLETGSATAFTPTDQMMQDRMAWADWRQTAIPETPLEELRRGKSGDGGGGSGIDLPAWAWLLIIGGGALLLISALKPGMPSVTFGSR